MFHTIKEFATIKQIMEHNSEFVRVSESERVKAVDCKVLSIMFNDLLGHKTVQKVEDEDYIFVRRAHNLKSQGKKDIKDLAAVKKQVSHLGGSGLRRHRAWARQVTLCPRQVAATAS